MMGVAILQGYRIGNPTSLARYDMGLATIIAKTDRDAKGQKMDGASCLFLFS
jgi:hypothetical protein